MQKLKYGAGSISLRSVKRKDGTERRYYQGRIFYCGRQFSVYSKTQAACLAKMKALREKLKKDDTKEIIRSTNVVKKQSREVVPASSEAAAPARTFGAWLDEWTKLFKTNLRSDYRGEFLKRVFVVKIALGGFELERLGAMDIQRYLNSLKRCNTKVKIFDVINGSLQKAEDVGILSRNPCRALERPTYEKQIRRAYELSEQSAMLAALGEKYGAVFFFLCCTGLRIGEFLALEPGDVDFTRRVIKVKSSRSLKTGKVSATKTAAGNRLVYFAPSLFETFNVNLLGIFSYNGIKKAFTRAIKALSIEGVSATHSCRHTYASMLACMGVPAKVIQSQLGHASITTTMDVYAEIMPAGESPIYKYIALLKSTLINTLILF